MVAHPGRRITQYDQAALFGSAYVKTMTMDKAVNGFESPGLLFVLNLTTVTQCTPTTIFLSLM